MKMFYSMIPPALVVLSLAGIIVFLLKKSRKVADFSAVAEEKKKFPSVGAVFSRRKIEPTEVVSNNLQGSWLSSSQKIFGKIRLAMTKTGNVFSSWKSAFEERRRKSKEDIASKEVYFKTREDEEKDQRESKGRSFFKRSAPEPEREENFFSRREVPEEFSKLPPDVEEKSQLEDALIERIASNPKDTEAYERLGQYYLEIGNYDHAKECLKQVMKLSPGNIGARSRMRKLERMLGG